jgi:hypothetical protein
MEMMTNENEHFTLDEAVAKLEKKSPPITDSS